MISFVSSPPSIFRPFFCLFSIASSFRRASKICLPRAETHVGLHAKYLPLLSDFNENWNMSTNFTTTP
jgi:hypothetical protein